MKNTLLSSTLIFACLVGTLHGCVPNVPVTIQQQHLTLHGRVHFPDATLQIKTTENALRSRATVSLLYPPDHASQANHTAAAGSTDATGAFQLSFDANFSPAVGELYILEASRRAGPAQQRQALRTWVRRTANGWDSLSAAHTVLDARTTALSALLHLKTLPINDFIGSLMLADGVTSYPSEIAALTTADVEEATTVAVGLLAQGEDPVAVLSQQNGQTLPVQVTNPQTNILQSLLHCPFCDLSGAALNGRNLNLAELQGANLSHADLRNATLIDAHLTDADLSRAQLSGATWVNGSTCEAGSTGVCQIESQINQSTLGIQNFAKIASDNQGNFVTVWQDNASYDGDGSGIFARRFDRLGLPQSPEFRVNTFTTGHQEAPDIAVAPDGRFVIVWQSSNDDPTGNGRDIIAQQYDSAGEKVGSPQRVNTFSSGNQGAPKIGMDNQGNMVILWFCSQRSGIFAQRYNAQMQPLGNEIAVPQISHSLPYSASLAMAPNGQFAVSWTDRDAHFEGIYARTFDAQGNPLSDDIPVNQYTTDQQEFSRVAMDQSGNIVVTWHSNYQDEAGIDSIPGLNGSGIYARRFASNGDALSNEFRVNTTVYSMQRFPAVAMAPEGHFAIVWESFGQDYAPEISGSGVYLQRFTALGQPIAGEQQVNTHTPSHQSNVAVSLSPKGHLNLVWSSGEQEYIDPDDPGPVWVGIFGKQIGFWP